MRVLNCLLFLYLLALLGSMPAYADDSVAEPTEMSVPVLVEEQTHAGQLNPSALESGTGAVRAGEASVGLIPESKSVLVAEHKLSKIKSAIAGGLPGAQAMNQLSRLVDTFPDYREARLLLGRQQIAQNDTDAALASLAPLLQPANPDWQPWFWIGTAYLSQGELELAKQHLETAVSKNSRVSALWVQMSVLSQELGEHSSALQYLLIAEQLNANYGQLHFNRAYSLEQLGRPDEARRAYQRFLISDIESSAKPLRIVAMQRIDTLSQGLEVATRSRFASESAAPAAQ